MLFYLLVSLILQAPSEEDRPNIILILADDLGYADLGCQGSDWYETPRLEQLAAEGLRFTDAYSSGPNCAPTRAALLSGQWGARTGVWTVQSGHRGQAKNRAMEPPQNERRLAASVVTLAESLNAAGYATGFVGKWHLGSEATGTGPTDQGFEFAIGGDLRGHPQGHLFPWGELPGLEEGEPGESLTARLTEEALGFVRAQSSRPFFLLLSHYAVHTPIEALPEDRAKFAKKPVAERHHHAGYAGMVLELDRQVGRLLDELSNLGLRENTLLVFTSDNGGLGGYAEAGVAGGREITDNFPMRGGKGMLTEGGVRVPLMVSWPGHGLEGKICREPVTTLDLYPTFLEIARVAPSFQQILDGTSLVPLLGSDVSFPVRSLVWHFPGYLQASSQKGTWRLTPSASIRRDVWKGVEDFTTGEWSLFRLDIDISEQVDVSQTFPKIVAEMRRELESWRQETGAPMPARKSP